MNNYVLDGVMGLVVADALGVPVEFNSSMTLCTVDSLSKGLDYKDMMNRFSSWMEDAAYSPYEEVFDIGNATSRAILNYTRGMEPTVI